MTHMNWSNPKLKQYLQLRLAPCGGSPDRRHQLQACTVRSPRTFFRKRRYWKCWHCNFREEMVK